MASYTCQYFTNYTMNINCMYIINDYLNLSIILGGFLRISFLHYEGFSLPGAYHLLYYARPVRNHCHHGIIQACTAHILYACFNGIIVAEA